MGAALPPDEKLKVETYATESDPLEDAMAALPRKARVRDPAEYTPKTWGVVVGDVAAPYHGRIGPDRREREANKLLLTGGDWRTTGPEPIPTPSRGKPGPASRITHELIEEIAGYVAEGNALMTAAQLAGVAEDTHKRWMREGRTGRIEPQRTYRARLVQAKASKEREIVKALLDGAARDPRLLLEWLRRRNPTQWEPRQRTDQRVTVGAKELSTAELERIIREEARKLPPAPDGGAT